VAAFSAHTCVADVTGDTFKPIDPKKPGSAAKKFPPHAMTAPALAPAVQGLVNEDPKVKPKALGTLLSQYILQKPTDAFVSKVKKCCSSSTATTKEENAGSIEGYAKLCVDAGNYVVVRKIDDAAMELVSYNYVCLFASYLSTGLCFRPLNRSWSREPQLPTPWRYGMPMKLTELASALSTKTVLTEAWSLRAALI